MGARRMPSHDSIDIDLLLTFLEVQQTRHFGKAADNLFITQSAVSARIRQLEQALGTSLFIRERHNIQLTPAGKKLIRHAESIVTNWNRARQELSIEDEQRTLLAVGGMPSLWDITLQDWLYHLHDHHPDIAVHAEAHGRDTLLRRLQDNSLDIAFLFEQTGLEHLVSQSITEIPLILVSSRPDQDLNEAMSNGYILVDWGTEFGLSHARFFPDLSPPRFRLGLGRLALAFLLDRGGCAYLAEPMVNPYLLTGTLHRVAAAPDIHRSAYAVYRKDSSRLPLIQQTLKFFSA